MTFRLLHTLALFWMMLGVGAVVIPIWRAWRTQDLDARALLLTEAQRNETPFLVPGLIATAVTGVIWAGEANWNLIRDGWLMALIVVFVIDSFIFIPLMGVGLRRVRLLALQAQKRGEMTDELREALADNVPVVFGTVLIATLPVMAWLAIYKPF